MAKEAQTSVGRINRLTSATEIVRENWLAYLFVVPTLFYLVFLVWYPWLQGFIMSFYDWPLFGPKEFIGLENYTYLLTWEVFWTSIRATLIYGTQTIGHLFFGTIMALIVWKTQNRWIVALTSIVFLIPYVIPPLVTGTLFKFLLNPSVGPFFTFLVEQGIMEEPIYWTTNGDAALIVITLIGVWTWSPLVFLLVIASLQSIPASYYELGEIYGANVWERFRYITYPQIKSTLLIAVILRTIWNLGKVSQPFQILRGGPGWETSILGILLYRLAWSRQAFGLAFATGVLLGLLALVFIVGFIYKFEQEQGDVQI